MSIRPIYLYGSAVLKEKARPVAKLSDEIVQIAIDMFETMYSSNGIGLAATQVGDLNRLIVVDVTGMNESDEEDAEAAAPERRTSPGLPTKLVLFNPQVVSVDGAWKMEEGCLSIPDVRANVERPQIVTVRYRDTEFRERELTADGMLARVIQHEIDHLDGVLFIDRIGKTQRSLLSRELRKIRKGEVETRYPVISDLTE
ncbi:MAG: peptide deformylase [Bacteroidetes bacterium]|jgi:peptide deformylase|nr:peptide deformylase [Bacteroidota bacterium]